MNLSFYGYKGIKLAAEAHGDPLDPAVLLLPRFGQTRSAWTRAAKALSTAGRYAVTVDLRGHGYSDWSPSGEYSLEDFVQDVKAVVAQLPSKPAIIGASVGGLAALAAVGETADPLATALVLIDAAPRMVPRGLDRITELMTADSRGFASVEEAINTISSHLPEREPPAPDELQRHLRRADDGRFRWHVDPAYQGFKVGSAARLTAQNRLKAAAAALDIPTLLVRGEESELIDQDSIDLFRELVPQAEFVDIAGARNMIVGDTGDRFDSAILEFLERRVPRQGAQPPRGGIEPRLLRDALGCFATGVTVITTTASDGKPVGFTANSFTSVSLDPPLVLFCIKRNSPNVQALRDRGAFAVNVLHIGQQGVSATFASRCEDRFAEIQWEYWDLGVPVILDAMANFECVIHQIVEGGDHYVVMGRVRRVQFDAGRDPLLFFQGKYRRIHISR